MNLLPFAGIGGSWTLALAVSFSGMYVYLSVFKPMVICDHYTTGSLLFLVLEWDSLE